MAADTQPILADRLRSLPPEQLAALRARSAAGQLSGSALVAEALRCCGIRRVFGVAGTPVDQIFSQCGARGIRLIGTRHQQAAVLAAAAGNHVAGRMDSAVVVSAGPAVTNTLTGVLTARDNGWPVLVLGGRRPLSQEGMGCFQELDALPIFSSVTKWAATPRRAGEVMDHVFQAFTLAMTARPGPVYLDLPEDVLVGSAPASTRAMPTVPSPVEADSASVEAAARLVREARRPLLIAGDGLLRASDAGALKRLVEDHGLPFITTSMARGCLPDEHPLCANEVRHQIQGLADVVVMAGAAFDWRFRFGAELSRDVRVVQVDAEAAAMGRNVEPELGVCADPGRFLARLTTALDTLPAGGPRPRLAGWHALLARLLREHREALAPWLHHESVPLASQQLFRAVRELLPTDAIVSGEGNVCLSTAQKILAFGRPASWLDPGWSGLIGGAIPFALGAKLACPGRLVVALASDTGFAMSAFELETAVRHDIPVVVVLANNDGNTGALRQKLFHRPEQPEKFCAFLPRLQYERIVELFGGHAERVTEAHELRPALERAIASGRVACVNVSLDPHAPHPGFW